MCTSMPSSVSIVIASAALGFIVSLSSRGILLVLVKSTFGLGMVMVPVLSTTIVSIWRSCSSAVASLMRMPFSAAFPMPTITAVGVANPMAQGQATTSTATALIMPCGTQSNPPNTTHATNVSTATHATTGTNISAARSTVRCTGAFEPCASRTIFTICARAVSSPT